MQTIFDYVYNENVIKTTFGCLPCPGGEGIQEGETEELEEDSSEKGGEGAEERKGEAVRES